MGWTLLTVAAAAGGGLLLMRLRVPGGMLVGAILGAVLVNLTTGQAYIWPQTRVVAQVLTGAYIGCLVTTEDLRHLPRVIRPYLAVMSTFLALNLAVGFFIWRVTDLDLLTSLFCAAPGGMTDTPLIALDMGADDYIAKPFHPQELVARVRSQLRRYTRLGDVNASARDRRIVNGRLSYDPDSRVLTADGDEVKLTATELGILALLMCNLGRVFPAEEIYRRVWGEEAYASENTVMVHIRRMREKLEQDPSHPQYLLTARGLGYKLQLAPTKNA